MGGEGGGQPGGSSRRRRRSSQHPHDRCSWSRPPAAGPAFQPSQPSPCTPMRSRLSRLSQPPPHPPPAARPPPQQTHPHLHGRAGEQQQPLDAHVHDDLARGAAHRLHPVGLVDDHRLPGDALRQGQQGEGEEAIHESGVGGGGGDNLPGDALRQGQQGGEEEEGTHERKAQQGGRKRRPATHEARSPIPPPRSHESCWLPGLEM